MNRHLDPSQEGSEASTTQAREQGLHLVVSLCAVIRVARAYRPGNRALLLQLENLADAIRPVMAKDGEAVLVMVDEELYLNGTRIPVNAFSFRFHRTIVECLQSAQIAGLRVSGKADPDELGRFFQILLDKNGPRGEAMVQACAAAGLSHTQPALIAHAQEESHASRKRRGPEPGDGVSTQINRLYEAGGGESAGFRLAEVVTGVRSVMAPTAIHPGMQMRHAKRLVQPLVEAASFTEPLLVGLSSLVEQDPNAYAHAVNVAATAVTIGQALGLDRGALADLGVAALFHDIGIEVAAQSIQGGADALSTEDRALLERHTVEGAKLLSASSPLNRTSMRCIRAALEHHAGCNGTGYPRLQDGYKLSLLSRIVSISDCYVSLIGRRKADGLLTTPCEALGMILGPLQNRFDSPLLKALVQSVGFFPPGQLVELDDGSIALSIAPNAADLARPHVQIMVEPDGRRPAPDRRRTLRPLPRERSVRRPLDADASVLIPAPGDPPAAEAA